MDWNNILPESVRRDQAFLCHVFPYSRFTDFRVAELTGRVVVGNNSPASGNVNRYTWAITTAGGSLNVAPPGELE